MCDKENPLNEPSEVPTETRMSNEKAVTDETEVILAEPVFETIDEESESRIVVAAVNESSRSLTLLNLSERKLRRQIVGTEDAGGEKRLVKSGLVGSRIGALPLKQKLLAVAMIVIVAIGALGAAGEFSVDENGEGGVLMRMAETVGLKEKSAASKALAARNTLQISKEYIYAGSRMLAVEDYGITAANPTPTPPSSSNSATFVRNDTTTQGNWIGNYGSQGHKLAGDGTNLPAWVQASFNGQSDHVWAASTADGRALKKAANNGDRLAACWYTPGITVGGAYTVAFNFTDGLEHQLAFYNLDWDAFNGRNQKLEVLDGVSGSILDTRNITNFTNGVYTVWKVKGQITVRVTNQQNNSNGVIGGFFIDAANAPPPSTPTPTPTPTPGASPSAPTIAQVLTNSHTQLDVYWNQPPAAQSVTSFNLRINGGQVVSGINALSYPVTGLTPGATYSFDVQAVNQYGTSGWSQAASGTTSTPGAPPVPTITSVGQNSNPTCLNITINGVAGANSYDVQITDSGTTINVTALSIPWCGLQPSTYYEYKARSVGTYGTSGWSANVGGTTAAPPPPATNNYSPMGHFDGIDGNLVVSGWSYDPDDPNNSNDVHIYIGGPAGSGTGYAVTASGSRPDVNNAFGIGGNHGFSFQIPAQHNTGQWTPVYIYGIDRGTNAPVLLQGSPQYFGNQPEPTPTPCNSNPYDVDTCENVFGRTWNYDTCTCSWSAEEQTAYEKQQQEESGKGLWDSVIETLSSWWN